MTNANGGERMKVEKDWVYWPDFCGEEEMRDLLAEGITRLVPDETREGSRVYELTPWAAKLVRIGMEFLERQKH